MMKLYTKNSMKHDKANGKAAIFTDMSCHRILLENVKKTPSL